MNRYLASALLLLWACSPNEPVEPEKPDPTPGKTTTDLTLSAAPFCGDWTKGDAVSVLDGNGKSGNFVNDIVEDVSFGKVAYCVAGEREPDYGNRGADDDRGHDFVYPVNSGEFNYESYNDVNESGEQSADDQAEVSDGYGSGPAESGEHGTEKRE